MHEIDEQISREARDRGRMTAMMLKALNEQHIGHVVDTAGLLDRLPQISNRTLAAIRSNYVAAQIALGQANLLLVRALEDENE